MEKEFFSRNPEIVAKELLGKILIRKIDGIEKRAKIVETEAYFGPKDPASRARQNGDLKKTMEMEPGTILVYGVHSNWLINFVTQQQGTASAVLIRAVEPLNFDGRGNGPGLLTKTLNINKKFHKQTIFNHPELSLLHQDQSFEIMAKNRVGVSEDMEKPLRFYIKENLHISRK